MLQTSKQKTDQTRTHKRKITKIKQTGKQGELDLMTLVSFSKSGEKKYGYEEPKT